LPALPNLWAERVLSILRIMAGLLFLEHGTAKLFGFPFVEMFAELDPLSLFGIAGIIELIGGALLTVGLLTRPVAFVLSGEMAAAYFMEHAKLSFFPLLNYGESAVLFCFVFFYFVFAGGGAWSLDRLLWPKPAER
jgi:putative oxidoreductase